MLLSVIIPTCNRNDLLGLCLSQLNPDVQTIEKGYEVIVADDSRDNVAKAFIEQNYSWVTWIQGPKKGPAANRNHGAAIAKGEWLVFIDDDCLPEKNILSEYSKAINERPEIVAYEGRIYVDTPQTSFLQEAPLNNSGGCFWSCNICIGKELFRKLNGFDENFPFAAMEDVEFFLRLKKVTDKYMFLHSAAVLHPYRTNKKLYKTILKRYQAQLYYISKHPQEKNRMSAAFYFRSFLVFFKYTLKNAWQFKFAGFGRKLCCDFLQVYFGMRALLNLDKEYNQNNFGNYLNEKRIS